MSRWGRIIGLIVLRNSIGVHLVWTSVGSRIISLWHVWMRWKLSFSNQSLNLLLIASFVFQVLFMRELRLMIDSVPLGIFLEFFTLGLLNKFFITDQSIFVGIGFLENMLPHSFHFFCSLLHIVFGRSSLVHLIQLVDEQYLHFVFIPESISIDVVQHEE